MPVQRIKVKNKYGYKWGKTGKVYHYTIGNEVSRKKAKARAIKQGIAIGEV